MTKFKDLHINLKVRIFVLLLQNASSNMILPFMAIYFTSHFGLKNAGVIMTATVIGSIVASFYGGYLADNIGRKKILVLCEAVRFIAVLFMALFNSEWITWPLVTAFLLLINNICFGLSTPAREAMIIDISTKETREYIYSLTYWTNNFSLAVGTMIGAFFYKSHFFELLLTTALFSLAICFILFRFMEETKLSYSYDRVKTSSNIITILKSYKEVFEDKVFLKFFIASLMTLGLGLQLGYYISARLSKEFQEQVIMDFSNWTLTLNGVEMFGVLRTENTILVIILAIIIAKIPKKLSGFKALVYGIILFTTGFMIVSVSNNFWILIAATTIFTLGELLHVPMKKVMLADIAKDHLRSRYMAVNSLVFRVGLLLGSLGILIGAYIPSWTMSLIYGSMGALSIWLFKKVNDTIYGFENLDDEQNKAL